MRENSETVKRVDFLKIEDLRKVMMKQSQIKTNNQIIQNLQVTVQSRYNPAAQIIIQHQFRYMPCSACNTKPSQHPKKNIQKKKFRF